MLYVRKMGLCYVLGGERWLYWRYVECETGCIDSMLKGMRCSLEGARNRLKLQHVRYLSYLLTPRRQQPQGAPVVHNGM